MDVDAPFLIKLGLLTNEEAFIQQGVDEILAYCQALQELEDKATLGLFWHGYESRCGRNGQLWARGNGWAIMGLVETLRLLPAEHKEREELQERLLKLCTAIQRFQHQDGLWHTVINHPETYLESTLAVMVAFTLRDAFEAGLLNMSQFGEMERKARSAAIKCINEAGELTLVSDATPVSELNMYATRPFGVFPWGQGPLLLMLSQSNYEG